MVNMYILLDTSYFIFYRYYALLNWWKLAKPEEELIIPFDNEEFVDKFKKTFISKIKEIPKKLKIDKQNPIIYAGLDCPRLEIWRHEIYPHYKETREKDDTFLGGPFFKLGIDLLKELNIKLLKLDKLEADDCVALTTKKLLNDDINNNIYIIANDMDYLQLVKPNVNIINLTYKNLNESKKSTNNSECNLFCKIVTGDKSDNIPGIFTKCGPKTAIKYFENKELFIKQLSKENANGLYERNRTLVDFNYIPEILQKDFIKSNFH